MNNEEKNTYVRQQITRTLIQLLEEKDISDVIALDGLHHLSFTLCHYLVGVDGAFLYLR